MPYPTELHPKDTRPHSDKQDDLIHLYAIQKILEEEIGSYAIHNPENIFDEDYQEILRELELSRGLSIHKIVIAPDGFIRWMSGKFPSSLLQDIHNALLSHMNAKELPKRDDQCLSEPLTAIRDRRKRIKDSA
jgi:hypothetical protein